MFYSHERKQGSFEGVEASTDMTQSSRTASMVLQLSGECSMTENPYIADGFRLVATLGSRSNLKKVTRKAILGVDVPKACDTITDPSNPLALRLQASLL